MSLSVEQTVNHFDRPIQRVADIIVRSPSLHSNLKQSTSFILSRKNIKPVLPSSLFVHEFYRNKHNKCSFQILHNGLRSLT